MSRVLLMAEQYQAALACIQELGRAGHECVVVAGRTPSPNASSKWVAKVVQPSLLVNTSEARARSLKALVESEKIDVVIPQSDDDALTLALAREMFPAVRAFVAPALESVRIACDKIRTLELAREIGLDVPESVIVAGRSNVAAAALSLGYPLVVKNPVSSASTGTFVLRKPAELPPVLPRVSTGNVLLQRFVSGDRVGATAFARDGQLVGWFGFRLLPGQEDGGTPPYALSDNDPKLKAVLSRIAERLQWTGGIDIDAIRDTRGKIFLLEINPRFSGTLVFADKLGVNLAGCYVDVVNGSESKVSEQPAGETLFVSYAFQEIALISRNPGSGLKRAAELRRAYRHVENMYPDDGPLCVAQMKAALHIAWRRGA